MMQQASSPPPAAASIERLDRGRPLHSHHHAAQPQLCGRPCPGRAPHRVSCLCHADRCRSPRRRGGTWTGAHPRDAGAAELGRRRRHHRHGGLLLSDAVVRDAGRSQRSDASRHPRRHDDGLRRRKAAHRACLARRRLRDGGRRLAVEQHTEGEGHPGPGFGHGLRHHHEHAHLCDRVPSLEPPCRDRDRQDARHGARAAVHVHCRHAAGGRLDDRGCGRTLGVGNVAAGGCSSSCTCPRFSSLCSSAPWC